MTTATVYPPVLPSAALPTQTQMFYAAHRKVAATNNDFMWLVQNGMTREDLARNIERRPTLWKRFEGFLDTLPSRHATPAVTLQ